jgi:hypothetical protein
MRCELLLNMEKKIFEINNKIVLNWIYQILNYFKIKLHYIILWREDDRLEY